MWHLRSNILKSNVFIGGVKGRRLISTFEEFSIFQSPITQSVCPQTLHKILLSNAPGKIVYSSEYSENSIKRTPSGPSQVSA